MYRWRLALGLVSTLGCTQVDPEFENLSCDDVETSICVEIREENSAELLVAVNSMLDDTTIVLGKDTFAYDNQVTIRGVSNVALVGQGMDETILDFADQETQTNGVDVVADGF